MRRLTQEEIDNFPEEYKQRVPVGCIVAPHIAEALDRALQLLPICIGAAGPLGSDIHLQGQAAVKELHTLINKDYGEQAHPVIPTVRLLDEIAVLRLRIAELEASDR